jgi:hypothetical protein
LATPGTLFGYSEAQFSRWVLGGGIIAVVLFKLVIIRYLVRNHKAGVAGGYVLYGMLALSVLSILVIVLLLNFWKV